MSLALTRYLIWTDLGRIACGSRNWRFQAEFEKKITSKKPEMVDEMFEFFSALFIKSQLSDGGATPVVFVNHQFHGTALLFWKLHQQQVVVILGAAYLFDLFPVDQNVKILSGKVMVPPPNQAQRGERLSLLQLHLQSIGWLAIPFVPIGIDKIIHRTDWADPIAVFAPLARCSGPTGDIGALQ